VGYGKLGEYLYKSFTEEEKYKTKFVVVFVWNRSYDKLEFGVPEHLRLKDLDKFPRNVDLIIEVAHPIITKTHGALFLQHADYFIGSPTALADKETEQIVQKSLEEIHQNPHAKKTGVYIPSGAFWGAIDIQKMQERGTLHSLCVTMKKHPSSFKVLGECKEKLDKYIEEDRAGECVLYEGSVRGLCPLAPNNVNTMACAAIAATGKGGLGFDGTVGCLVADKSLTAHVITIDAKGKPKEDGSPPFSVFTTRYNPAQPGAVTGSATYGSFASSVERAQNQGCGTHFC